MHVLFIYLVDVRLVVPIFGFSMRFFFLSLLCSLSVSPSLCNHFVPKKEMNTLLCTKHQMTTKLNDRDKRAGARKRPSEILYYYYVFVSVFERRKYEKQQKITTIAALIILFSTARADCC